MGVGHVATLVQKRKRRVRSTHATRRAAKLAALQQAEHSEPEGRPVCDGARLIARRIAPRWGTVRPIRRYHRRAFIFTSRIDPLRNRNPTCRHAPLAPGRQPGPRPRRRGAPDAPTRAGRPGGIWGSAKGVDALSTELHGQNATQSPIGIVPYLAEMPVAVLGRTPGAVTTTTFDCLGECQHQRGASKLRLFQPHRDAARPCPRLPPHAISAECAGQLAAVASQEANYCEPLAAASLALLTPRDRPTMPAPTHTVTVTAADVCVRVELPEVKKASEVDLNISAERLHFIADSAELAIDLPHAVLDEEASAKFDKKAHVLTLTMPRATPGAEEFV